MQKDNQKKTDLNQSSSNTVRLPPCDLRAEKAVIAAMMIEPGFAVPEAVKLLGSQSSSFYDPKYKIIFKVLVELNDKRKPIDFISISHELKKINKLEDIGGEIFLAELENSIATTVNLEEHCNIIYDLANLRRMINICVEAKEQCYDLNKNVNEIIEKIESTILDVRRPVEETMVELKNIIKPVFEDLAKIMAGEVEPGIKTGFPDLDAVTTGLKPGEMFILAARPSIGKTALALNILKNITQRQDPKTGELAYPVAFFSLEMTVDQIIQRLISTEAQVSMATFFNGNFNNNNMGKLTTAVSSLKISNMTIDPTPGLSLSELKNKARRLKQSKGIKLVVIDYLQLMRVEGKVDSREREVATISAGIKALAKELNIPFLVLAQLNRDVEKAGANSRPKLSSLRDSGSIEQDADVVAFLHRDRTKQQESTPESEREGLDAEIIIEKNRNGQIKIINVKFFAQFMEFRTVRNIPAPNEGN